MTEHSELHEKLTPAKHSVAAKLRWLPSSNLTIRVAIFLTFLVAMAILYFAGNNVFEFEKLVAQETSLRRMVDANPLGSFAICFLIYLILSFVPGTTGKSFVVGWLMGFWAALFIVNLGLTMAATGTLLFSRYLVRETICQRFEKFVSYADKSVDNHGGLFVLLLRLLHAPFTVVNYSLGATSISSRTFWCSTQIGLLPGNIVFVFAGSQIPTLRELSENGISSMMSLELILAFVLLTLFPLVIHGAVAKFWKRLDRQ